MNAPQMRSEENYPRSIVIGLVLASITFLGLDYYLLLNTPVYWQYGGFFQKLDIFLTNAYTMIDSSVILLINIHLFIQMIFIFMLWFYLFKLVKNFFSKKDDIEKKLQYEGSNDPDKLLITNFLTFKKNGIAVYHVLSLLLLTIHFLGGQMFIYRVATAFERTGADANWVYIFPILTFITLFLTTLALIYLKDKISLKNLTYLLDRIMILLVFIALYTLGFVDTEGMYVAGLIFTFPLLYLTLLKLNKPVSYHIKKEYLDHEGDQLNEESEDQGISKSMILIFATTVFMLIFALLFFSIAVQEHNQFNANYGEELSLLNRFTLTYIGIMIIVSFIMYRLTIGYSLEVLETRLKQVFIFITLIFFVSFVYDDFFFEIAEWGQNRSILFLEYFVLTQLPVSILLGVVIAYGSKISSGNEKISSDEEQEILVKS